MCLKTNVVFFYESFNQQKFNKAIGQDITFVQDNHSKSKKGVLRGLHYQEEPYAQAKLLRVISGEVFDVAVDIRKYSETYGQWVGQILSATNKYQLWIPVGFAHGFLTISDEAELLYKTTMVYSKEHENIIVWDDSTLRVKWPFVDSIKLAAKDRLGVSFLQI